MKIDSIRNVLIFLLVFLGLGAIGGGGVLIMSPSGEWFGMPLSMLDKSPFKKFLAPGVILFLILGLVPIFVAWGLMRKPASKIAERFNFFFDMHWAWTFSIYIAFALIIWIQLEMVFLQAIHWLHTLYMFYAVAIILVALLPAVRWQYRK